MKIVRQIVDVHTHCPEHIAVILQNGIAGGIQCRKRRAVGDKIGVAPATIGGAMTAAVVTSVKNAKDGDTDVWECVLDGTITANKGDVLVEAGSDDKMLVKNINAFADSDADMPIAGTSDGSDFDNAKYLYTPAVGGAFIIIHKMSPLPKCVRDINKSPYNGLFKVPGVE